MAGRKGMETYPLETKQEEISKLLNIKPGIHLMHPLVSAAQITLR